MIDHEALFTSVAAGDWAGALDLVRREPDPLPDDPVTGQALEVLVSAIDGRLGGEDLADDEVERYVLLGRAGRLPVGRGREARAVESLLHRYRALPERALAVARFRPDLPGAIAVIGQYGRPEAVRVDAGDGAHRVTAAGAGPGAVDAGRPLFRSPIERAFHAAACRVFPGAVVQCNVALHAALDFERIRGRLTADERRHFFHGLVDCVVFDPEREFRPVRFYELDSALHDDAVRQERDGLKDRILSVAGHRLLRIRPAGRSGEAAGEAALERLLREIEKSDSVYIDRPQGRPVPESRTGP